MPPRRRHHREASRGRPARGDAPTSPSSTSSAESDARHEHVHGVSPLAEASDGSDGGYDSSDSSYSQRRLIHEAERSDAKSSNAKPSGNARRRKRQKLAQIAFGVTVLVAVALLVVLLALNQHGGQSRDGEESAGLGAPEVDESSAQGSTSEAPDTSAGSLTTADDETISSSRTADPTGKEATAQGADNDDDDDDDDDAEESRDGCFPLSPPTSLAGGVPSVSRDDWWCDDDELYGFLGFSYPLEVIDCDHESNKYDKIAKDVKTMKDDFGASMVRVYAPECRELSVWEALVRACAENDIGLIVMVWWGFNEDQSLYQKTQQALFDLLESSEQAEMAPYVVDSASFGSEPIGDHVAGGAEGFMELLKEFRKTPSDYDIPVGISEDWDRPGVMSDGDGLADVGKSVKAATDVTHAHIMPYYHPDAVPLCGGAWEYVSQQLEWLREQVDQPLFITQTMWASEKGWHGRGGHEDQISLACHETYWQAFADNCETFKAVRAGWFMHTFDDSQGKRKGSVLGRTSPPEYICGWI